MAVSSPLAVAVGVATRPRRIAWATAAVLFADASLILCVWSLWRGLDAVFIGVDVAMKSQDEATYWALVTVWRLLLHGVAVGLPTLGGVLVLAIAPRVPVLRTSGPLLLAVGFSVLWIPVALLGTFILGA